MLYLTDTVFISYFSKTLLGKALLMNTYNLHFDVELTKNWQYSMNNHCYNLSLSLNFDFHISISKLYCKLFETPKNNY